MQDPTNVIPETESQSVLDPRDPNLVAPSSNPTTPTLHVRRRSRMSTEATNSSDVPFKIFEGHPINVKTHAGPTKDAESELDLMDLDGEKENLGLDNAVSIGN